ncbi:MAG: ATP-binding protein [Gammaproteobacteria bacterium]|nr:ATP-binding protein [Gammaproteobacteria bacterium]
MIHKFSVSNYHSIREEAILDLRIPGTAPALPCFRRSAVRPDIRLPSVAVLMGPNGSGKTTLLRALITVAEVVSSVPLAGNNPIKAVLPFLSESAKGEPTLFCVEFETARLLPGDIPQLFRYELGLERRDPEAITNATFRHEALLHFPRGRPRRLIKRGEPGKPIYVSGDFGLRPGDDRLKAVRADTSVISTLAMFNVPLAVRIVEGLRTLVAWSTNILAHGTWSFPTKDVIDMFENQPVLSDWIQSQIQCSDLGIRGVRVADGGTGEKLVWFDHDGLDTPILLNFESSGTKRLFHLLPQLGFALNVTGVAVLDEIDGDLHVDIAGEILRWFRSRESNPHGAQLFVTSHNVGLLDDLEKEEVFIVEKDDSGATRVHGAQDVRGLRRDARLYPKYRAGVLGGIPRFG